MSDTATISFRTDPTIKREAKELYADMGMDLSKASNIYMVIGFCGLFMMPLTG